MKQDQLTGADLDNNDLGGGCQTLILVQHLSGNWYRMETLILKIWFLTLG